MTVAELIKALSEMDPAAEVVIAVDVPGPEIPIDFVQSANGYYSNDDVVEIG